MENLSNDAKALMGAWFGMGGSKSSVTLHMRESVPTVRCRAAIDELVAAGAISKKPFNQWGGEVYRPLVDTYPFCDFLMDKAQNDPEAIRFQLMEPVSNGEVRGTIDISSQATLKDISA